MFESFLVNDGDDSDVTMLDARLEYRWLLVVKSPLIGFAFALLLINIYLLIIINHTIYFYFSRSTDFKRYDNVSAVHPPYFPLSGFRYPFCESLDQDQLEY